MGSATGHTGVGVGGGEAGDEELPGRQHPVAAVWEEEQDGGEKLACGGVQRKGWR